MFIYNFKESKLPDIASLKSNVDTELFMLNNQISSALNNEEKIYECFVNLSIRNFLSLENASILSDFNSSFVLTSKIVEELNSLKIKLEDVQNLINNTDFENDEFNKESFLKNIQEVLEEYYSNRTTIQNKIMRENRKLNKLVDSLYKYDKKISTPKKSTVNKVIPIHEETKKVPKSNKVHNFIPNKPSNEIKEEPKLPKALAKKTSTKPKKEVAAEKQPVKEKISKEDLKNRLFVDNFDNENKTPKLEDNHLLLISEKDNKVYLPYFVTDLQQNLLTSDYETYEELIENDYTFPLDKYKSPIISRFKEGFKLMHDKEHESFGTSLTFGLRLMNNYKLHPAVITACRNVDELNSFLDCLDQNGLSTFDIFDIKFDISPTTKF